MRLKHTGCPHQGSRRWRFGVRQQQSGLRCELHDAHPLKRRGLFQVGLEKGL